MGEGNLHSLKSYEKIGAVRPPINGHDSWRKKALVIFLAVCSVALAVSAVFLGTGFFRPNNEESKGLEGTRTPDLIEIVCNKTLYYDACNSSLTSNPASARANMSELAKIAVESSLEIAKGAADLSRKLKGTGGGGVFEVCVEVLQSTVDELNDSLSVVARPNWIHRREDVKSWLSAALTNPTTCIEGFEDLDENIPTSLKKMVDSLSKLVSNALAIFNYIAAEESNGTAQKISRQNRRLLTYVGDFYVA